MSKDYMRLETTCLKTVLVLRRVIPIDKCLVANSVLRRLFPDPRRLTLVVCHIAFPIFCISFLHLAPEIFSAAMTKRVS